MLNIRKSSWRHVHFFIACKWQNNWKYGFPILYFLINDWWFYQCSSDSSNPSSLIFLFLQISIKQTRTRSVPPHPIEVTIATALATDFSQVNRPSMQPLHHAGNGHASDFRGRKKFVELDKMDNHVSSYRHFTI